MLTIVPLLAILFSVLKAFGVHNRLEPFLADFLRPLGARGAEISLQMISFVDNIKVGVLGAVGVIFLLYGVVSMLQMVESAFNAIWQTPHRRPLWRRLRNYALMIFIAPLFLFLSFAAAAFVEYAGVVQKYIGIDLKESGLGLAPLALHTIVFTLLLKVMPNVRVEWKAALGSGLAAALAWKVLGILFAWFISLSSSYADIYAAFAGLIMFMIWIHLGWVVVLFAALLSCYLQDRRGDKI